MDIQINILPSASDNAALRNYPQQFTYDALGNKQQMKSVGDWTRNYIYNTQTNNYLQSHTENTTEYQYDKHGNTTKMPHLETLCWDYLDQMTSANLGGGGEAFYTYDSTGNRTRKIVEKSGKVYDRIYIGNGYEMYRLKDSIIWL